VSRKKRPAPPAPPGRYRPFEELRDRVGPDEDVRTQPEPERPQAPPSGRSGGGPSRDEDVFAEAVADAVPLERDDVVHAGTPRPARLPDEEREWKEFARDLMRGRESFDVSWSDEYVEGRRHEVTAGTMRRLKAGRIAWEAYLDLHGMTRDEARRRVDAFIRGARMREQGCVLLVHGRGKGSHGGVPVLKEKLVAWLTRDGGPGAHVLAFATARPCDGGPGALYVLVRAGPPPGGGQG
jgi:DNA-nicking Smr family endonuclease